MPRAVLRAGFVSLLLLSTELAITFAHAAAAGDHLWKSYTNERFQYAICYPRICWFRKANRRIATARNF
jgi:hypothetical protein